MNLCKLACVVFDRWLLVVLETPSVDSTWDVQSLSTKAAASLHAAGFKTNYLDLTYRDTGSVVGVGNTLATAASMVAPLLAGYVLEEFGWDRMFQMVFLVNVSGSILFGVFADATCLDEVKEEKKKD